MTNINGAILKAFGDMETKAFRADEQYDRGYDAGVVDGVRQAVALACKRGLKYSKGKEILQELLKGEERLDEFVKELFS